MVDEDLRKARRHEGAEADQREEFERDRDRILYSSAFRRLAGVTQIVRAGEGDAFHTRLTHTMKVAQIGRRLAQRCVRDQPEAAAHFGLEPEVVEAACLAHDLGHPPFGHIGESQLCKLVQGTEDEPDQPAADGYEGNAQSFRVITRLAVRFPKAKCNGLDLTRATLTACLKYPWMRDLQDSDRSGKWGAYYSEQSDFEFALSGWQVGLKTLESELMDWADDVAYSVHDLEDLHRYGLIPWHYLFDSEELNQIIRDAVHKWHNAPPDAFERLHTAAVSIKKFLKEYVPDMLQRAYEGDREQRRDIRYCTSSLIGKYIRALEIVEPAEWHEGTSTVRINEALSDQVRFLKQLTRWYLITSPALAAQQFGQQKLIGILFEALCDDLSQRRYRILPKSLRHIADQSPFERRAAADCIASMTEREAVSLHSRLTGLDVGSVLDPIIR